MELRRRTLSLLSVNSVTSSYGARPSTPAPSILGTHSAQGSFSPTESASSSLKNLFLHTSQQRDRRHSQYGSLSSSTSLPPSPVIIVHPPCSPPSPIDNMSSISSSPTLLDVPSMSQRRSKTLPLDPILASVEKKSKFFRDVMKCCTCGKKGGNFPKCPRCDDIWCSRECRLVGGKRHICSRPL